MKNFILLGIILIIISFVIGLSVNKTAFVNYIAHYAPKSQKNWWQREGWERFGYPAYTYWENFEDLTDRPASLNAETNTSLLKNHLENEESALDSPDTPGHANLYNNQPYHLLADELQPPRTKESISCVNSRSCYATDFERTISKTGNFRQITNNYKRNYPDSCSAPYQELVLNFYKAAT